MGRCCSAPVRPSDDEANMSAAIEEKMLADLASQEKVVKILLLGTTHRQQPTLVPYVNAGNDYDNRIGG
jgi:hypothetical protein